MATTNLPVSMTNRNGSKREIALFFALAYAISWTFWLVAIVLHLSVAPGRSLPGRVLYFAGIQGPWLAGLILSLRGGGWKQVRRYYGTIVRSPVNPLWIIAALFGFPAIAVAAVALATLHGGVSWPHPMIVAPPMGWPMLLFGQVLIMHGEEYGWRGFALPRMEKLGGTLGASLVLGVLWAMWHLPLFWTSGSWQSGSLTTYIAATTAICVVQAMFFFRANRSTLAAMLFHGGLNATQFIFNAPESSLRYFPVTWLVAVLVCVAVMPRPWFRLTPSSEGHPTD